MPLPSFPTQPPPRKPGAALASARSFGRFLRATLAAGSVCALTAAAAHEWSSPGPAGQVEPGSDPSADAAWPGLAWAGPNSGPPSAPSAEHCRRAPRAIDWPEPAGEASAQQVRPRRHAGGSTLPRPEARSLRESPKVSDSPGGAAPRDLAAAETAAAPGRHRLGPEDGFPAPAPVSPPARPADEPVTAGVVDDNADFGGYLAFRDRRLQGDGLARRVRPLDVSARHRLVVHDAAGRPVPDARVTATLDGRPVPLWARTDAAGQAWLHPRAAGVQAGRIALQVSAGREDAEARGTAWLVPGQRDALQVTLDAEVPPAPTRLDLVFLVDATGSMADEIDKLKRSMRAMAAQIARLPQAPEVCWGLVAYRDRGDAFFVRSWDFTDRLDAFQSVLAQLQAQGGGDMPEALNEGLHAAVHRMSWRGEGTTRMVLLVGDAPPHRGGPAPTVDVDARAALARGIKLMALGASGLDAAGEFVFRQMAQFTGGRFVFLTYARRHDPSSGPGRETVHDVEGYSVETLDRLIVRLVREELAARPAR